MSEIKASCSCGVEAKIQTSRKAPWPDRKRECVCGGSSVHFEVDDEELNRLQAEPVQGPLAEAL